MINKNDRLVVTIDDMGNNFEGIAHFEGNTIFVSGAIVGEKAEIQIVFAKKNLYFGKLLRVIESSPFRIFPKCKYFEKCGGCDCQHIDYEYTLKLKSEAIKLAFKKIANVEIDVPTVIASDKIYGYRNKISLPVQSVNGKTIFGLYKKNSHDIVSIDSCDIQDSATNKLIEIFRDYIEKFKIVGYDEIKKTGTLRHIVARIIDNSILVTLVVTNTSIVGLEYLALKLKESFDKYGLNLNINRQNNNVILGDKNKHISGEKELVLNEYGIKYCVNNMSFLQVNNDIKNAIYDKVLSLINENDNVIDAYSGAGLLTAIMSKKCKKAIGIEIVPEANQNANQLIKENNIENVTNYVGDTADLLPQIIENGNDYTIILDPPRTGCDEKVLNTILDSNAKKIIYISCSPQTLARDYKILSTKYNIKFIQPYDMFPQTKHVETLLLLAKK